MIVVLLIGYTKSLQTRFLESQHHVRIENGRALRPTPVYILIYVLILELRMLFDSLSALRVHKHYLHELALVERELVLGYAAVDRKWSVVHLGRIPSFRLIVVIRTVSLLTLHYGADRPIWISDLHWNLSPTLLHPVVQGVVLLLFPAVAGAAAVF